MSTTKVTLWSLLACLTLATGLGPAQAQTGLKVRPNNGAPQAPWPRWQARIGVVTNAAADASASGQIHAGQLLGDYYWGGMRLGESDRVGGFRATSGLLLGQHSLPLGTPALASGQRTSLTVSSRGMRPTLPAVGDGANEALTAVPYVGIGYSGMSLRWGWGFTADVGVATGNGLRAGRDSEIGTQGLDELLRELRLRPVLQVGASYAF